MFYNIEYIVFIDVCVFMYVYTHIYMIIISLNILNI